MSLQDAAAEIADQMIAEAEDLKGQEVHAGSLAYFCASLKGFARQLRTAVTAAAREEGEEQASPVNPLAFTDPRYQNFMGVEAAKEQLRAQKRLAEGLELIGAQGAGAPGGQQIALCIGGPLDGTNAPIDPQMPAGAKTLLEQQVYEFRGGQFHYSEESTREYFESQGRPYTPWQPAKSPILLP